MCPITPENVTANSTNKRQGLDQGWCKLDCLSTCWHMIRVWRARTEIGGREIFRMEAPKSSAVKSAAPRGQFCSQHFSGAQPALWGWAWGIWALTAIRWKRMLSWLQLGLASERHLLPAAGFRWEHLRVKAPLPSFEKWALHTALLWSK